MRRIFSCTAENPFILMNSYPYNPGHLMIAPYRHLDDLSKLAHEEPAELIQEVARGVQALRQIMNPAGFNLGMNVGKVAGAGIEDHLHLHVVPRWSVNTNFMPVVGATKVIPEHPAATYRKLASLFRSTGKSGEGDAH